jgi:tRNA nucleotidyltransferase (CCA-adding enzyme)
VELHPAVLSIARAVRGAGGRALLAGGLVRDRLRLGDRMPEPRDYDLEVYGVEPDALRALLARVGRVDAVGEAFTVYKLAFGEGPSRVEVDVGLPRRDSKVGPGHKGFRVTGDPRMPVEEACRRRDFTVNAMLQDPLGGELIDPWGGRRDLETGVLRAVDPATFGEDSLRVLRGAQFAARFGFRLDPATAALCRTIPLDDLPSERVWGEVEKLLLRAERPSIGLAAARETGAVERLFPELEALAGCPQEPDWHPEGDVWIHTLQAVDLAAGLIEGLDRPRRTVVMLGTLCHDLGKPSTTKRIDGRIRSLDHEAAGLAPTERVLDGLNVHTMDGYDVRAQVLAIVGNHLKPGLFHEERDRIGDGAFRRLALKCEIDLLYRVAKADSLGRRAPGAKEPSSAAQEWFLDRARRLALEQAGPRPILKGRHLLEMGLTPGPRVGEIVEKVFQLQLDGTVTTLDEARDAARRMLPA